MRLHRLFICLTVLFLALAAFPAMAQLSKKDKKKAEKQNQDTKTADPKFNFYFFSGLKDKSLNNMEPALENFNRCLELDPTNDAVMFEIAKIYVLRNMNDKAAELMEQAVKISPDQEWYLQLQAQIYEETNKQEQAANCYKHLLELYPDRVEFFFKLANAYIFSNKFTDALKVYDKLEAQIGITEDVAIQKQKI